MVDVSELVRFTPGEKTLRMAMDIAAAIERYRIVMEGPAVLVQGGKKRW